MNHSIKSVPIWPNKVVGPELVANQIRRKIGHNLLDKNRYFLDFAGFSLM
jgi:hypothetical protein